MIATRSWNDLLFLQYSGQIDSLQNIGNTLCILITRVLSYSKYQPGAVPLCCKQRSSSTPLDSPSERLTSMTESLKNVRREQQIIMREEKCQSATLHFITCSVQKVRYGKNSLTLSDLVIIPEKTKGLVKKHDVLQCIQRTCSS